LAPIIRSGPDPDCQRELNRWHSARRQAKRRQDHNVKVQHAQAEQARRQRAKSLPQPVENSELAPPRGHTTRTFFLWPLCDRPGCYRLPASSIRNQARYCSCACRQAVRNALDRERKWRSRGTLDGRKKRAIEYQAAKYPDLSAVRVHEEIARGLDGYTGSVITVRRYLRKVRPARGRVYQEVHYEPGQAMQVDWGESGRVRIGNTTRKVSVR
jgi:hypothetical protein